MSSLLVVKCELRYNKISRGQDKKVSDIEIFILFLVFSRFQCYRWVYSETACKVHKNI